MVLLQERAYGIAKDASIECALQNAKFCLFAQETGTAIRRNGANRRTDATKVASVRAENDVKRGNETN